ncbi:unnamed protein product, partial [Porites lobata]
KWERCKRLISGEQILNKAGTLRNDSEILGIYRLDQDCACVLQTRFVHPPVSKEEEQLPIAFGLIVHKANSVDVVWGHITLVEAQFSCMEELLKSPVKWKYYISLVGQDFPLYDNKQIVRALQGLNNTNNIISSPMPEHFSYRVNFVHILKGHAVRKRTNIPKVPPPHNISIYKGSTHIIALREFVDFALHSQ